MDDVCIPQRIPRAWEPLKKNNKGLKAVLGQYELITNRITRVSHARIALATQYTSRMGTVKVKQEEEFWKTGTWARREKVAKKS